MTWYGSSGAPVSRAVAIADQVRDRVRAHVRQSQPQLMTEIITTIGGAEHTVRDVLENMIEYGELALDSDMRVVVRGAGK